MISIKIHKTKVNYAYYIVKKLLPKFLSNKLYRKYYDYETQEIIQKEYYKDLKTFNYEF